MPAPTNPFYQFSGALVAGETARSGQVNSFEQQIQIGFDGVYNMLLGCFRVTGRSPLPGINDFATALAANICANKVVGLDSTGTVIALVNASLNPRGAWLTATDYERGDLVTAGVEQSLYVGAVSQVSGTFSTDFTAGKWVRILDNTSAYQASFRGKIIVFADSPYQALAGDDLMVDVSTGPVTIVLPASPSITDQPVGITHIDGNISSNNITVSRNGNLIMKLAEDMFITSTNASLMLGFSDAARGYRLVRGT